MACARDEYYLGIIGQLMADKDRLLTEKDELLMSKDRLWRKMYNINRERDLHTAQHSPTVADTSSDSHIAIENEALRKEVERLKSGNVQLETLMRQMMEEEKSSDEEDSMQLVWDEMLNGGQEEPLNGGQIVPERDFIRDSGYDDSSWQSTHNTSNRIIVASNPSMVFNFKAVVESTSVTTRSYGRLAELASGVPISLQALMVEIINRPRLHAANRNGTRTGCARQYILTEGDTYWTIEKPRFFACMTCFNKRRAYFIGLGDSQWIVLPLPPGLRQHGLVWTDEAYYIYQRGSTSMSFPGTWASKKSSGKKKKKATKVIEEAEGLEEADEVAEAAYAEMAAVQTKREDEDEEF